MSRNRDYLPLLGWTLISCSPKQHDLLLKPLMEKPSCLQKSQEVVKQSQVVSDLIFVVVVVFKEISSSNCIVLIYPHFPPDLHCWGKKYFSNLIQSISEWVANINPYWLVVEVSAHPYWPRRQIQTKEKNEINILLMGQYIFILARNLNLIFLMPSVGKKMKTIKRNKHILKERKDMLFQAT